MTWDEVLSFESNIHAVAVTFVGRADDYDYLEDLKSELRLDLFLTVDLSKATGKHSSYVDACLWNHASTHLFYGRNGKDRKRGQSLDDLIALDKTSAPKSRNPDVAALRRTYTGLDNGQGESSSDY